MKILGRRENVDLLDLSISRVSAKIDTGAFGNSIHCDDIQLIDDKIKFTIGDKTFIYDKYRTVVVKNSFGETQKRFLILTKIKLGNSVYKIYISLSNRKDMRHPMLIGRRFLYKFKFMVDVSKKNLYDRTEEM